MAPKKQAATGKPAAGKKGAGRRRVKRNVPHGVATVKSTFNNTIVSISDNQGNVLAWSSGGSQGFKGSKKSTPFAATLSAQACARKVQDMGMRSVDVFTRGPGSGRESAIRALMASGLDLTAIRDVTPIPHNGCRPKKRRRV
ncbi:MAG: 30S ribosomal protein S11 [bacterium]